MTDGHRRQHGGQGEPFRYRLLFYLVRFHDGSSNGSVNSMHDSYTPLGGFVQMLQIALGEVVFGGVGCGLYGMIGFAILTVFIAGLMVGRTPEFLGKKIGRRDALGSCPVLGDSVCHSGVLGHRLHGARSCRPAQQWWRARLLRGGVRLHLMRRQQRLGVCRPELQHPWINVMLGLEMLFARFLPIIGTLAIAGSLAKKGRVAESAGTLSTTNGMFVFLLVFVVLLIGALSFFPALALGPVAESFQMIA